MKALSVLSAGPRALKYKEGVSKLCFVMHKSYGADAVTMLKGYGVEAFGMYKAIFAHEIYPGLVSVDVPQEELSVITFYVPKDDAQYAEMLCMYYGLLCCPEPMYNSKTYKSRRNRMPPVNTKRGGGSGYGRGRPKPKPEEEKNIFGFRSKSKSKDKPKAKDKPKSKAKDKPKPKAPGFLERNLGLKRS